MKVEKRIHSGWKEINGCNDGMGKGTPETQNWCGKYQYIYSDDKGNKISLVELFGYELMGGKWEIFQIEGNEQLFDDVERFQTKEEAEKRIKELL